MSARVKNVRDIVTNIRQSLSSGASGGGTQGQPTTSSSVSWESIQEPQETPQSSRPNYSTWKYPSKAHNLCEYPPPYNSQTNKMTNLLPRVLARRRKEFAKSTAPRAFNNLPRPPPRVELSREINYNKKPQKYVMQSEKEHYSYTARLENLQPNRMRECVQAMDFKTPK